MSQVPARSKSRRSALPFRLVTAVVGLGAVVAIAGSDALITVNGNGGDTLGTSVALAGDIDGDGVQDFIVGAPTGGYVLVVSGKDGSTIHTIKGNSTTDGFGASVAGVGDVDGDSVPDILVGAPLEYVSKVQTGSAHLYSGKDGSLLYDYPGDNSGDAFGSSVGSAGDVDGDGVIDVIVGGRTATNPNQKRSTPGMVKVYYGNSSKPQYVLYGATSGDGFGASVCGLGDVDGDGVDDFAVGADTGANGSNGATGIVAVFSGSSTSQIQTYYGDAKGDGFGASIAPAGDVDSDKVRDIIVGAPTGLNAKGTDVGYARVISNSGGKTIYTFYGDGSGDLFGQSVAGVGDVDADGVEDFVVGAPKMLDTGSSATGAARTFSGSDGSKINTVFGANAGDQFGAAVVIADDLDGDGTQDVGVGIPHDGANGTDAGAMVVIGGGAAIVGPTGTVVINSNATATSSTSVTLSLNWTAGTADVTEMRLRNAGGAWGSWTTVASSSPFTLTSGDGTKTVEAMYRDAGGLESPAATDAIVLDATAPTGSVNVNTGTAWTNTSAVTLALTAVDAGSGVAQVRVRNSGGAFGAWTNYVASLPWTLATGAGSKTVDVQFNDGVGNISTTYSDSISVDVEAPTGSILIAGGAGGVRDRTVTLTLAAGDTGGSGLGGMRLRTKGASVWGDWQTYSPSAPWDLTPGDGLQSIEVQYRDIALNLSAIYEDGIVLDEGRPTIDAFALHAPRRFFLSNETIEFDVTATDPGEGSGINAIRATWDGGNSYTPWVPFVSGSVYAPARPTGAGVFSAQVVVRDAAGNESRSSDPIPVAVVSSDAPNLGSGGTASGAMADANDVDVIAIDLVAGDALNVALKAKSGVKKQAFVLALDLVGPNGDRYIEGRFPVAQKGTAIKGYIAPETGRYLLIVRHADVDGAATGTYSTKVTVKHAAANAAGSGTTESGEFTFDAAAGSVVTATLRGDGIDPASVVIEGPDGTMTPTTKVKKTTVSVGPTALTTGTGTYTVRFTATGPVQFSWKTTLPKANVKVTE